MKSLSFFNFVNLKSIPRGKYFAEIRRYLFLLLIPVILLVALYVSVYRVVTKQIDDYSQLTINYFYSQADTMLNEMQVVGNSLKRNRLVRDHLDSMKDEQSQALAVCHEISSVIEDSPCVQHVYLIEETSGKIYSDQGFFSEDSLDTFLTNLGINDLELSKPDVSGTAHVLNENRLAPYYISSITGEDGQTLGTMIITLRMTEFLKIFYSLNCEFCAIFNDDVYISTNFNQINTDDFDWYSEEDISELIDAPVKCTYLETEKYTYIVAVAKTDFSQPLKPVLYAFVLYLVAVVALGYLYLYHVSKKRYKNIEKLLSTLPVSNQGNQTYETIYDDIRTSLQNYQNQHDLYQQWRTERQLRELLSNRMSKGTLKQYEEVGFPTTGDYTFYTVIFFTTHVVDPSLQIDNMDDVREYVRALFRSTIGRLSEEHGVSFAFCTEHNMQVAIFYHKETALLKNAVHEISHNVIELLGENYELDIKATISRPFVSLNELYASFEETVSLHQFAMSINSTAPTVSQEELQNNSNVLLSGDFIRQEQILINTILSKKYDSVPSMVESILSTHVAVLRKNYPLAQVRLSSIANVLAEGVRMSPLSETEMETAARSFEKPGSIQHLIETTQQIYQKMAVCSEDSDSQSDIIRLACSYIVQNLSDPNLNVAVICESAGVSPQRLTKMFHAKFNMAIAEYMNYLRIEKVKELLLESDMTVIQIAQQVGYTNTDTLTRNFKKIEGITPSEYRRMQSAK